MRFWLSTLRKHAYAIYTSIFHGCKIDDFQMKKCDTFLIFASNIDCGYTWVHRCGLTEAGLTSTHDLCFKAKIRKKMYTAVNPSLTTGI